MNGPWTLSRASAALASIMTGARPAGHEPLGMVSTDTRTIAPGDIFVALVGERFDGHTFIATAVAAGAHAVVVSRPESAAGCGVPAFVVTDTTVALGLLGRWWRRLWNGTVIGIAGSNGKTSTKNMLASVLGTTFKVHATAGNLNNHVGVPLTLLSIPGDADVAVVEIGTNHPGEVASLRDAAVPSMAVVTSIGEEHLEGLGSMDIVLREEASLCVGVSHAVVPVEPAALAEAVRALGAHVTTVGLDAGEVRPEAWGMNEDGHGWLQLGAGRVVLPLMGGHNLRNAMLAVAVGRATGVADDLILAGLASAQQPAMRSRLESIGRLRVLNDAYNANPASAREALSTFDAIGGEGQRVVVLGSMLELGPQSPGLHDDVARRALSSRARVIGAVGEFRAAFERVAPGDARVVCGADAVSLWAALEPRLQPDALILLKGSRGTRLERLLPFLQAFAGVPVTDPGHH